MTQQDKFGIRAGMVALLCLGGSVCADPLCPRDMARLLAARGLSFDTNKACRAAMEAVAKTIDPRATIRPLKAGAETADSSVELAESWPENIRYLRLRGLNADVETSIPGHLLPWVAQGSVGAILDLRNAGGTNIDAVCGLAGFFFGETNRLFALVKAGGETNRVFAGRGVQRYPGHVPLMVLINHLTENAAELLAAVLRGRGGVMLIGASTFGDASLRDLIPLTEEEGIWIATARLLPAGAPDYHARGVAPDIHAVTGLTGAMATNAPPVLSASGRPLSEKARSDLCLMQKVADDPCLSRAAELLLALKALRAGTHAALLEPGAAP